MPKPDRVFEITQCRLDSHDKEIESRVLTEATERAVAWIGSRDYGNWGDTDALRAAILAGQSDRVGALVDALRDIDALDGFGRAATPQLMRQRRDAALAEWEGK